MRTMCIYIIIALILMCVIPRAENIHYFGICVIPEHVKTWTKHLRIDLDCSSRSLTNIPVSSLPLFETKAGNKGGITNLLLQNNKIAYIRPGIFTAREFQFLTYLDISDNPIKYLSHKTFKGLGNLTELNIQNDYILEIAEGSSWNGVFGHLFNLRNLKLPTVQNQSSNLIEIVGNMRDLEYISLILEKDMLIPLGIDILPKLRKLEFTRGGEIEYLNLGGNDNVSHLHSLSLAWADLHFIPSAVISNFINVQDLILSGNSRLGYQYALQLISNLSHWDIKRLSLDHISENIISINGTDFNLTSVRNLTHLTLRANNIATLDFTFLKYLPKLQYIALGYNILTTIIPKQFFHGVFPFTQEMLPFKMPSNLAFVDMSQRYGTPAAYINMYKSSSGYFSNDFFTELVNFIFDFSDCESPHYVIVNGTQLYKNWGCLQILSYSYQYMSSNDQMIPFDYSNSIRYLDISYTQGADRARLSKLNPMPKLEDIDLSCSRIISVADDFLSGAPNVQYLHLEYNMLGLGSNNFTALFMYTPKLLELYMRANHIAYIPKNAFIHLPLLKCLDVAQNQFTIFDVTINSPPMHYLDLTDNVLNENIISLDSRNSIASNVANTSNLRISLFPYIDCSCHTLSFFKWMDMTNITLDFYQVYLNCSVNGELIHYANALKTLHTSEECQVLWIRITIGFSCALVVILVTIIITYRFRIYIVWAMYTTRQNMFGLQLQKEVSRRIKFHAYISVAREDLQWVKDNILPKLEHEWDLMVYVYERDSIGGIAICDNIIYGMSRSSCIIVILSYNFIREDWRAFELNMAIGSRKGDRLFIIEIDNLAQYHKQMGKLLKQLLKPSSQAVRCNWTCDNELGKEIVWTKLKQYFNKIRRENSKNNYEDEQSLVSSLHE